MSFLQSKGLLEQEILRYDLLYNSNDAKSFFCGLSDGAVNFAGSQPAQSQAVDTFARAGRSRG
jgi:hypothetical protein